MQRTKIRLAAGSMALFGLAAGPLGAASTLAQQHLTPQGSASTTPNGDYISSSIAEGGLNAPYRYFVEVPPGLTRLVVDIFDPDVGLGGTGEDDAGRDRDRNGYDTAVSYTLFNPSGAQRNTLFTTGNNTTPAGSDNAWVTFFDSTGDTVRDNFGTAAYTNNDGQMNWAGNWIETNDDANAGNGDVRITGGELRIGDNNNANVSRIEREANLSGFTTATFSFDFRSSGLDTNDTLRVEVSNNGGGSWATLENFVAPFANGSRSYNITSSIAATTRIRFSVVSGYGNNDFFFVDNLQIKDSAIRAGHWEVRVDQSSTVTAGNDINAFGLRAHDGTAGSGGTELNLYYDSQSQLGVNPDPGSNSRTYTLYPYITSGCSASKNDFDFDRDSGNTGSLSFASRTGVFTQSYASTALSQDDEWRRDTFSGWTSDSKAGEYGIWTAGLTINTYGATSGNYTNLWMGNYQAAGPAPAANPTANAFRVYFPNDAGTAPVKPYLEQVLTFTGCGGLSGPNPPVVGQTSCFTVNVRVVNPTSQSITFSSSNLVTANVPGGAVVYGGTAQVTQGSVVSQPAVNGSGNITWNPGTVAAGATEFLAYRVKVTPTSSARIPVTATPASGNGTRAQYVDETGNTTQARATYLFGPLCELATGTGVITHAVVSGVHAWRGDGGGVRIEWKTASEAGTAGFYLHRWDAAARRWVRVSETLLAALQSAPQGGTYRFLDEGASPAEPQIYRIEEVEAGGGHRMHGPYALAVDWRRPEDEGVRSAAMTGTYDRTAQPAARRKGVPIAPAFDKDKETGDGAHLSIRETGLYYLRAADIAQWLGLPQKTVETKIAAGKMELTRAGQPVAWLPEAPDGKTGQGLFFYGEALGSLYSAGSVYRLRHGRDGLLMETRTVSAGSGSGSFPAVLHLERDAFPATLLALDPESDYWFWEFLQAGDPTYGRRAFTADLPGLAAGPAALTVRLQGATDSGVAGEHHALVSVNGTPLGETSWQGIAGRSATFDVPPGVLQAAGNQIEVTAEVGAGAPYSIVYVNAFDLSYRRTFAAGGNALAFTPDSPAGVTVAGFSDPAVQLLDVSNPLRPRSLRGAAVTSDGGGWTLGFNAAAGARYLAAAPGAFKAPAAVRPWSVPSLLAIRGKIDYLVIAPAAWHAAAQRLADLRQRRGLKTLVVDLEQIYDEIGDGSVNPHAVQAFLAIAARTWRQPPRYVALAGAGSLDYRNLLGFGDSLVPPLLVQSRGGLFPSDNALADADGDGLPEMAVGRIPALTAQALDAYTDKLAAAESGSAAGWARNVLLLADVNDGATDFAAESGRIAAHLGAGYAAETIALQSTPLAAARARLLDGLAGGASLVNYMGHGGLDRLSAGGLLTSADAAALANGGRLPVVTAMTCTINRFAVPGVPSLGEALVTSLGGAAAVWGPSGLADNAQSRLLAELFYRSTSDADDRPLGDRILRAFGEYRTLGGDGSLLHIYNLLGDPLLRLRRAPETPGTGRSSGE